jgi:hypothetical protein
VEPSRSSDATTNGRRSHLGLTVPPSLLARADEEINARPPVVGIIRGQPLQEPSPRTKRGETLHYDSFRQGLLDLGYVEGQTIVLESGWPTGRQFDDRH